MCCHILVRLLTQLVRQAFCEALNGRFRRIVGCVAAEMNAMSDMVQSAGQWCLRWVRNPLFRASIDDHGLVFLVEHRLQHIIAQS